MLECLLRWLRWVQLVALGFYCPQVPREHSSACCYLASRRDYVWESPTTRWSVMLLHLSMPHQFLPLPKRSGSPWQPLAPSPTGPAWKPPHRPPFHYSVWALWSCCKCCSAYVPARSSHNASDLLFLSLASHSLGCIVCRQLGRSCHG